MTMELFVMYVVKGAGEGLGMLAVFVAALIAFELTGIFRVRTGRIEEKE